MPRKSGIPPAETERAIANRRNDGQPAQGIDTMPLKTVSESEIHRQDLSSSIEVCTGFALK